MDKNPYGRFEWSRRRRIIYGALAFCATAAIALHWAALRGMDGTLLNTLVVSNYGLAGAVIGSYVFGAIWDDRNSRVYGDGYAPTPVDSDPNPPGIPG